MCYGLVRGQNHIRLPKNGEGNLVFVVRKTQAFKYELILCKVMQEQIFFYSEKGLNKCETQTKGAQIIDTKQQNKKRKKH